MHHSLTYRLSVAFMVDELEGISPEAHAFAERLASALGPTPQAVVAKRAQISASQMSAYMRGTEPGAFRLARLAKALGVSLQWLATGEGGPGAAQSGFDVIPIYDVRLAAGVSKFGDAAEKIGEMPIDFDMLRRAGLIDAEGLVATWSDGDSMEPTIADGARVILNTKDTRLREGVFGFRLYDDLRIKRLRRVGQDIQIISDNPRYEPELVSGEHLNSFQIIGRVVMGLSIL